MQLNNLAQRFIDTQNNFDSKAFADCFTETAIVHDEGKTYKGRQEIQRWIEHSNESYKPTTKALKYEESGSNGVLTAEVSGTFPGSPGVLHFHMGLKNDLIDSLKVTG